MPTVHTSIKIAQMANSASISNSRKPFNCMDLRHLIPQYRCSVQNFLWDPCMHCRLTFHLSQLHKPSQDNFSVSVYVWDNSVRKTWWRITTQVIKNLQTAELLLNIMGFAHPTSMSKLLTAICSLSNVLSCLNIAHSNHPLYLHLYSRRMKDLLLWMESVMTSSSGIWLRTNDSLTKPYTMAFGRCY